MAGPALTTDAFVLEKRVPTDTSQGFQIFSADQGLVSVWQRLAKKSQRVALDLFDECSLQLQSSNEGRTWFVTEARLLSRPSGIGRSYEALRAASSLARLIVRNPVHEDSRGLVAALLKAALGALDRGERPDIIYLKSLYRFLRDEGYPAKEEWFANLTGPMQSQIAPLLNRPLSEQTADIASVQKWRESLEHYIRASTELILE